MDKKAGKLVHFALVCLVLLISLSNITRALLIEVSDDAPGNSVLNVPLFNQNDTRWYGEQLGTCLNYYIGNKYGYDKAAGCLVTSLAMVMKYFHISVNIPSEHSTTGKKREGMDPSILNDWLRWKGGYSDGCLVNWTNFPKGLNISDKQYNESKTGISPKTYAFIDKALENARPVIAGVHWAGKSEDSHWVVIIGRSGNTYVINDPWGGIQTTLERGALGGYIIDHYRSLSLSPILCAGTSNPGLVYRYFGDTNWQPISTPAALGNAYAVLSLVEYDGHLYAGTMSTSSPSGGVGRVYRYDGGTSWTLVGNNLDNQISFLAVYKGKLYAGTAWNGMKLYRYEGGTTWKQVIDPVIWNGTRTLHPSHNYLLLGDIAWDYIGRWDGSSFTPCQTATKGSCIYDFEDYGGYVYAAGYKGVMWQSPDGINWRVVLGYDYYKGNMWELETFQDFLYMAYANGELRASRIPEHGDRGILIYIAPDGIISMETDGVNLYFGTGGEAGALFGSKIDGIANVYKYDGNTITLISEKDKFGGGVQVLYFLTPKAPEVTTNEATVVTPTGAKLNADLTSLGTAIAVNASFQWREESGDYSNETTPKPMDATGAFSFDLIGLKPGTLYYFRAKAVGDGITYDEEKGFVTPHENPICFIATAVYGSAFHPFVKTLQEFRDKYLMPHKLGRVMVDTYYRYSPSVAEIISKNKILKVVLRACFLPIVALSYSILHLGPALTAFLLVTILMFSISLFLIKRGSNRRRKRG